MGEQHGEVIRKETAVCFGGDAKPEDLLRTCKTLNVSAIWVIITIGSVIGLIIVLVVMYIKHRKLYSEYTLLMGDGNGRGGGGGGRGGDGAQFPSETLFDDDEEDDGGRNVRGNYAIDED